jgi:hypothetical protein
MSDPQEVDQIDDENITQPDPQEDPNSGVAPNGIPYPQPDSRIGEVLKY